MNYSKPEIGILGSVTDSTQGQPKCICLCIDVYPPDFQILYNTNGPAYESDE